MPRKRALDRYVTATVDRHGKERFRFRKGGVDFYISPPGSKACAVLLLQDSVKLRDEKEKMLPHGDSQWELVWEGRRMADRDERFRLYRRLP